MGRTTRSLIVSAMSACLSAVVTAGARGQDASEIVKRCDDLMRGHSNRAELTMTIVKPDWTRKMSMKTWSLGTAYGLVLVTAPARDKGTVTLKRQGEVWTYVPSIERTIKIPPSMMLQSWLGSDYTNDDLVKESSLLTDYTHRLSGDSTIEGHPCYRIELTPKPEAPVVWGKIVLYASKNGYLELRTEYYDQDGSLSRILTGSNVRRIGGRTLPTHWEMTPQNESGHKTVLDYGTWDFDIPLTESFFSLQNMNRIR